MNNGVNKDILNTYSAQSFSHWLWTKHKQRGCELSRALVLSPVKSSCLFGYNMHNFHKYPPWCQQERALTLDWEQDDHTSASPFLLSGKTKQNKTNWNHSILHMSEGGTKPREIRMSLLAQEPGSSQCCFPPWPSAVGGMCWCWACRSIPYQGCQNSLPQGCETLPMLAQPTQDFWRNATQNQPPLLLHRQAPAKPGQHCSGLQRSQHSLNAQYGQPFDLPAQLTLSVLHEDHCKGLPPKPESNIHREAAAGFSLNKRDGICTSLLLHRLHIPRRCATPLWSPRHHKNSLGKEAVWIWHGAVLQEWDNRNHAVMLVGLLEMRQGGTNTQKRERR